MARRVANLETLSAMPLRVTRHYWRLAGCGFLVVLCSCTEPADRGSLPDVAGSWELYAAENDVDTLRMKAGTTAELQLSTDSVFWFRYGEQQPAQGSYRVVWEEVGGKGELPVLRLSDAPEYFAMDSTFVLRVSADTMVLVSLWTDNWDHRFVRQSGGH